MLTRSASFLILSSMIIDILVALDDWFCWFCWFCWFWITLSTVNWIICFDVSVWWFGKAELLLLLLTSLLGSARNWDRVNSIDSEIGGRLESGWGGYPGWWEVCCCSPWYLGSLESEPRESDLRWSWGDIRASCGEIRRGSPRPSCWRRRS